MELAVLDQKQPLGEKKKLNVSLLIARFGVCLLLYLYLCC